MLPPFHPRKLVTGHSQVDHRKYLIFYIDHNPWLISKFTGHDYREKNEVGGVVSITVSSIIVQHPRVPQTLS